MLNFFKLQYAKTHKNGAYVDTLAAKLTTKNEPTPEPDDVFIIGGAMFYKTMLPYCSEVLVTKVDADGGAEVFYENLDKLDNWSLTSENEQVETNGYKIKFTVYKNSNVKSF